MLVKKVDDYKYKGKLGIINIKWVVLKEHLLRSHCKIFLEPLAHQTHGLLWPILTLQQELLTKFMELKFTKPAMGRNRSLYSETCSESTAIVTKLLLIRTGSLATMCSCLKCWIQSTPERETTSRK